MRQSIASRFKTRLAQGCLADGYKVLYSKFKGGSKEKPPGLGEAIQKEQSMIHNSMDVYGSFGKVQEYVSHANGEI